MCAITIHCEGFHELNDKTSVEPGETTFLELYLKPCGENQKPEMMLVTGEVHHAVNGEAVPGVEILFFRDEWVREHKPEYERRPVIIFKYLDENSDGFPEIMLLEADFDGDKRTDLHYVYIDENSDGNPEEIAIEASFIPWDFQLDLPGMDRYLNMMGWGYDDWEEEEWDEEWDDEWEDENWEEDDWEDEDWDDDGQNGDPRRGDDDTSGDEDPEKEEREKEEREKEGCEKEEREKEGCEKEEREKEGCEKGEREKEERKEKNPDNRPKDSFVAKTDREGFFELKMPAGEYSVVVEAEGYLPYKEHFSIYHMVEPKPDGEPNEMPEYHIKIDLLPEDFDPQFMELPPGEMEEAQGDGEKAGIDAKIREFMDDDSYEMDIEPFKELVAGNTEPGENADKEDDDTDGTGAGGESKGSFLEGEYSPEGLITGGVAIALMTLLLIFVIVTKKRNKKTMEDPHEDRSEPEDKSMKTKIVRKRPRPKVRTVRLRRKMSSE